jgi:hypothetical protein
MAPTTQLVGVTLAPNQSQNCCHDVESRLPSAIGSMLDWLLVHDSPPDTRLFAFVVADLHYTRALGINLTSASGDDVLSDPDFGKWKQIADEFHGSGGCRRYAGRWTRWSGNLPPTRWSGASPRRSWFCGAPRPVWLRSSFPNGSWFQHPVTARSRFCE